MEQEYKMEEHLVEEYCDYLRQEEKAKDTIQKYRLDLMQFFNFLPREKIITKQVVISYKEMLAEKYKISSANSKIAVVNAFLMYKGWQECKVKRYKMQRHIFCDQEKELTREEYVRMVNAAIKRGNERLAFLMETICATGIRVSELSDITYEAVVKGYAEVRCKGKVRRVMLVRQLQKKLLKYCQKRGIKKRNVFVTRNGNPLNRSNI